MENILFSTNVVLPLLLIMLLGYTMRHFGFVTGKSVSQFNSVTFTSFLPILLFNNIRTSTLDAMNNVGLFVYIAVASIALFLIASLLVPLIEPLNSRRGVMAQGIARSNYSLFGIALLSLLMPNADISVASILIAIIIPIYNVSAVIILTYFGTSQVTAKSILIGIAKNPLIIGTVLGMLCLFFDITLPTFLDEALFDLGSIAMPLSLYLLGAGFEFNKLGEILPQTIISVSARLLLVPAVTLTIAVLLGFRDVELACIMIAFGSPTAVSSYPMAEKMGGDASLASAIVLFTSIFSIFSLFLIILVLRTLGLI